MDEEPHENTVCKVTLFDNFISAPTFRGILHAFHQLCTGLDTDPLVDHAGFYAKIRTVLLSYWKAEKLLSLLDKRVQQKEYKKQKACQSLRVLIVGAGPCGLRAAVECALLGAKVVVVEKRDRFSRNNVLHLWPFVIQDLRNLGAKLFYPKFCAGSIEHISIRQLQCILLKVALLFGVEVHENVSFEELLEPHKLPSSADAQVTGWRARFSPDSHYVSDYEFDVVIGADGKRNLLPGFKRKEMRGKLAIGITANFINQNSAVEQRVQEISGVACIFNPTFFKELKEATAIDLENIVYYKDETHYFVMCAKKQSLLDKKVIIRDCDDAQLLLAPENVDMKALLRYAREAADFSTNGELPSLDYAPNHYGLPDVAMFDFTSLFSAENSCLMIERNNKRLVISIVGDSLHEPFWPTGSGCARGFLGVFDTAWLLRAYSSGRYTPLEIIAERESIYRLLAQTTPENLHKQINKYTIDPKTRYPNLDRPSILPGQVRHLLDSDGAFSAMEMMQIPGGYVKARDSSGGIMLVPGGNCPEIAATMKDHRRGRRSSGLFQPPSAQMYPDFWSQHVRRGQLIRWCQQVVQPYRLRVDNLTTSFRNGMVLAAILDRFGVAPDVLEFGALDPKQALVNNEKVVAVIRDHLNLLCPSVEMLSSPALSKVQMTQFIGALHDHFKTHKKNGLLVTSPLASTSKSNSLNRISNAQPNAAKQSVATTNKRKLSRENVLQFSRASPTERIRFSEERKTKEDLQREERNKRRIEELQLMFAGRENYRYQPEIKKTVKVGPVDKLDESRLKVVNDLIFQDSPTRLRIKREQKPQLKARKFDPKEIDDMKSKLQDSIFGKIYLEEKYEKQREQNMSSMDQKLIKEKTAVLKQRAQQGFKEESERFEDFDKNLKDLDRKMKQPNRSGAVAVSALLEQHSKAITPVKQVENHVPVARVPSKPLLMPPENVQPFCYFCHKPVYLAEKLFAEGHTMHKNCFKCEYCQTKLRLENFGYDRETGHLNTSGMGRFYCKTHLKLPLHEKLSRLPKGSVRLYDGAATSSPAPFGGVLSQSYSSDSSPRPAHVNGAAPTSVPRSTLPPPVPPKSGASPIHSLPLMSPTTSVGDSPSSPANTNSVRSVSAASNQNHSTPERAEFEFTLRRTKPTTSSAVENNAADLTTRDGAALIGANLNSNSKLLAPNLLKQGHIAADEVEREELEAASDEEDLEELDEDDILSQIGGHQSDANSLDGGGRVTNGGGISSGEDEESSDVDTSSEEDYLSVSEEAEIEETLRKEPYFTTDTLMRIASRLKRRRSKENILSSSSSSSSSDNDDDRASSCSESGTPHGCGDSSAATVTRNNSSKTGKNRNRKPERTGSGRSPASTISDTNNTTNSSVYFTPASTQANRKLDSESSVRRQISDDLQAPIASLKFIDESLVSPEDVFATPICRPPTKALRTTQSLSENLVSSGFVSRAKQELCSETVPSLKSPTEKGASQMLRQRSFDVAATSTDSLLNSDRVLGSDVQTNPVLDFDKVKSEARARARLKSDEELLNRALCKSLSISLSSGLASAGLQSARKSDQSSNSVLSSPLCHQTVVKRQSAPEEISEETTTVSSTVLCESFSKQPEKPASLSLASTTIAELQSSRQSADTDESQEQNKFTPFVSPKRSIFSKLFSPKHEKSSSPHSSKDLPSPPPRETRSLVSSPQSPIGTPLALSTVRRPPLVDTPNSPSKGGYDVVVLGSPPGGTNSTDGSSDLLYTGAAVQMTLLSESVRETSLLGHGSRKHRKRMQKSSSPPPVSEGFHHTRNHGTNLEKQPVFGADSEEEPLDEMVARASDGTSARSSISKQSSSTSNISDRDIGRAQRVTAKFMKQQEMKRMRQAQEIQRSLYELEVQQKEVIGAGRVLEIKLEKEPQSKELLDAWRLLVVEYETNLRSRTDFNTRIRELELEQQHCRLQQQMHERMLIPQERKTRQDILDETRLLERIGQIVRERNELVTQLEDERKRDIASCGDRGLKLRQAGGKDLHSSMFSPVFRCLDEETDV